MTFATATAIVDGPPLKIEAAALAAAALAQMRVIRVLSAVFKKLMSAPSILPARAAGSTTGTKPRECAPIWVRRQDKHRKLCAWEGEHRGNFA
jgi:hypothetical protein